MELWRWAGHLSKSQMVPKNYQGKPNDVLIAAQMGARIGLDPLQSVQSIATINGRPSLWGDTMLAICRVHPDFEDIEETIAGEGGEMVATCKVKRRGQTPVVRTFSYMDAKSAGLIGKDGPWKSYTRRMMQVRARGFALRDAMTDALGGLHLAEESRDIPNGGDPPLSHYVDAVLDEPPEGVIKTGKSRGVVESDARVPVAERSEHAKANVTVVAETTEQEAPPQPKTNKAAAAKPQQPVTQTKTDENGQLEAGF
jgi:hypothetical protein